jgi:purine-binding chemotaxis protein CheW
VSVHAASGALDAAEAGEVVSFVTATIADQLFGIPIGRAHDVFNVRTVTPVPLSPPDIVGLMNLRGRVVTALDIRQRLGFSPASLEAGAMAIGIESGGDAFGLVVDRIGEIVTVDGAALDENPVHLDPAWAGLSRGVYRLDTELLVVLDVDAILEPALPLPDTLRVSESPQ